MRWNMPVDIKVPSVGESITEGTVARWFKKDGEPVHSEEPLFELETEKATTEIPAPADGVLHITVREGKTVPIGSVVGRIDEKAAAERPSRKEQRGDGALKRHEEEKRPKEPPKEKSEMPEPQAKGQAA